MAREAVMLVGVDTSSLLRQHVALARLVQLQIERVLTEGVFQGLMPQLRQ